MEKKQLVRLSPVQDKAEVKRELTAADVHDGGTIVTLA